MQLLCLGEQEGTSAELQQIKLCQAYGTGTWSG